YEVMHGIGYPDLKILYGLEDCSMLADYFVSFDEITTRSIRNLPCSSIKVMKVNHPWFYLLESGSYDSVIPHSWIISRDLFSRTKHYKKTVLYSLQWGFDGEYPYIDYKIKNGVIESVVEEAIERSDR